MSKNRRGAREKFFGCNVSIHVLSGRGGIRRGVGETAIRVISEEHGIYAPLSIAEGEQVMMWQPKALEELLMTIFDPESSMSWSGAYWNVSPMSGMNVTSGILGGGSTVSSSDLAEHPLHIKDPIAPAVATISAGYQGVTVSVLGTGNFSGLSLVKVELSDGETITATATTTVAVINVSKVRAFDAASGQTAETMRYVPDTNTLTNSTASMTVGVGGSISLTAVAGCGSLTDLAEAYFPRNNGVVTPTWTVQKPAGSQATFTVGGQGTNTGARPQFGPLDLPGAYTLTAHAGRSSLSVVVRGVDFAFVDNWGNRLPFLHSVSDRELEMLAALNLPEDTLLKVAGEKIFRIKVSGLGTDTFGGNLVSEHANGNYIATEPLEFTGEGTNPRTFLSKPAIAYRGELSEAVQDYFFGKVILIHNPVIRFDRDIGNLEIEKDNESKFVIQGILGVDTSDAEARAMYDTNGKLMFFGEKLERLRSRSRLIYEVGKEIRFFIRPLDENDLIQQMFQTKIGTIYWDFDTNATGPNNGLNDQKIPLELGVSTINRVNKFDPHDGLPVEQRFSTQYKPESSGFTADLEVREPDPDNPNLRIGKRKGLYSIFRNGSTRPSFKYVKEPENLQQGAQPDNSTVWVRYSIEGHHRKQNIVACVLGWHPKRNDSKLLGGGNMPWLDWPIAIHEAEKHFGDVTAQMLESTDNLKLNGVFWNPQLFYNEEKIYRAYVHRTRLALHESLGEPIPNNSNPLKNADCEKVNEWINKAFPEKIGPWLETWSWKVFNPNKAGKEDSLSGEHIQFGVPFDGNTPDAVLEEAKTQADKKGDEYSVVHKRPIGNERVKTFVGDRIQITCPDSHQNLPPTGEPPNIHANPVFDIIQTPQKNLINIVGVAIRKEAFRIGDFTVDYGDNGEAPSADPTAPKAPTYDATTDEMIALMIYQFKRLQQINHMRTHGDQSRYTKLQELKWDDWTQPMHGVSVFLALEAYLEQMIDPRVSYRYLLKNGILDHFAACYNKAVVMVQQDPRLDGSTPESLTKRGHAVSVLNQAWKLIEKFYPEMQYRGSDQYDVNIQKPPNS